MTLEHQVTSLELSKRLKELGVKQESLFLWVKACGSGEWSLKSDEAFDHMASLAADDEVAAYTVAELGEMLPRELPKASYATHLQQKWITKQGHTCDCEHCDKQSVKQVVEVIYYNGGFEGWQGDTEVEARANCLVFMLEQKLITL
jgi:hypothetical protein